MRDAAGVLGGIVLMVLATLCFGILDTSAKYVAASVPVLMVVAMRYLLQALLSTLVLAPVHGRVLLQVRHPWLQLLRALSFAVTTLLALLALQHMPVGEFTAVIMVTPMLVTALAVLLFKERIAPLQVLCVLGGLAGTLVIVRPGGALALGDAMVYPLACIVASTAFQLMSSWLGRLEHPAATHFWTMWICALLGLAAMPWAWSRIDDLATWALMVLMAASGALGHFLLAQAYQRAPASTLMPYMYCQIAFAIAAGAFAFGHLPDAWAWLGIAVIAACGMTSAWLTAQRQRPPALQRAP